MMGDPDHVTSTCSSHVSFSISDHLTLQMVFEFPCNFCDRYYSSRKPIIEHLKKYHNMNPVTIVDHFSDCKKVPEPKKVMKRNPLVAIKVAASFIAQSYNHRFAVNSLACHQQSQRVKPDKLIYQRTFPWGDIESLLTEL